MFPIAMLAFATHAAEPHRSFYDLPSSNGWGAVVVDLQQGKAHHFRDHLFATEEPRWDAHGNEVWNGAFPEAVMTRDLLYDAYFGLRAHGDQTWLPDLPVDLDASGYRGHRRDGSMGGTPIIDVVQQWGDLKVTTSYWAPWGLESASMAMVLTVENTGATTVDDLTAFSLHNLRLGEGRPGPTEDIGAENETVVLHGSGIEERGFAGVTALLPLRDPTARSAWYSGAGWPNGYEVVAAGGTQDLQPRAGDQGVHTDTVSYLQWDHGTLEPGDTTSFGLVLSHYGDPFAYNPVLANLESWRAGRDAIGTLEAEVDLWADFQTTVTLTDGLSAEEEDLYRHGAVVLRMAQVREDRTYLREWLTRDGEERFSHFGALPGEVTHLAKGGVLASLPPGRWTYAWPRDGAYAIVGMALAGMHDESREALRYLLDAETNRYGHYSELDSYPIIDDYQISLCRHHGFGLEESDTHGDGDFNFEFDGAGLFLWALGEYTRITGDTTLLEERWPEIRDEVAGFLPPLIDDDGLILADSSIWEHHWFGAERKWAFTSLTAARGLCEAADLAQLMGDKASADAFRADAERIRAGIQDNLTDANGAVAQTLEELQLGHGYADAATVEAVGFHLFDPAGQIAAGTLDLIVTELQTPDGPGFSRNDDAWDAHDLSWWGSSYDSDEWVWVDLRMAVATRDAGDTVLADELLTWITEQSTANYLAIGETYDPFTADYTNNAPMVGYGSGAYIMALHHRAGTYTPGAACGTYEGGEDPGPDTGDTDDTGPVDPDTGDSGTPDDTGSPGHDTAPPPEEPSPPGETDTGTSGGCGCDVGGGPPTAAMLALLALAIRRR